MNICMILSSGMSARFKGGLPKQYTILNGAEVVSYCVRAMKQSKYTDAVVCVANKDMVQRLGKQYSMDTAVGGTTRNQSIYNGLVYIKEKYPLCSNLLICEAARPFVTADLIDEYFLGLKEYDGVVTAQYITDSLGNYQEAVTDRSQYYLIQAPEAFRFDLLYQHFKAGSSITATCQQLPAGVRIYHNFRFRHNLKITYPEDLVIAEALMRYLDEKAGSA